MPSQPVGTGGQPLPYTPIVPPPVPQNNPPPIPAAPPSGQTGLGQDITASINNLLNTNGALDQNAINSRVDQARGQFDALRKGQLSQDQAEMADRGLLGSGAEGNALGTLDKNLGQQYGSALSGILGDQYQAADQRMMQALTTGAGMSEADAQRIIDAYNSQTGRAGTVGELGLQGQAIGLQGQLGNRGLDVQQSLGQGGLDLQKLLGLGQQGIQSQLGNRGLDVQQSLGQGGLDLQKLLGLGQQGIEQQQTTNQLNLGQGALDLQKLLGLGQQGIAQGSLDLQKQLGLGQQGIEQQQLANQLQLGQGGLDLQKLLGTGDLQLRQMLGQGQLDLGNKGLQEDYSKFLGNLGLDRDKLAAMIQQGDTGALGSILQAILGASGTANQGYF